MDKVRFGVVGTNFISDWVIAGARQDERGGNLIQLGGLHQQSRLIIVRIAVCADMGCAGEHILR